MVLGIEAMYAPAAIEILLGTVLGLVFHVWALNNSVTG